MMDVGTIRRTHARTPKHRQCKAEWRGYSADDLKSMVDARTRALP